MKIHSNSFEKRLITVCSTALKFCLVVFLLLSNQGTKAFDNTNGQKFSLASNNLLPSARSNSTWTSTATPDSRIEIKNDGLEFNAATHSRAHLQQTLDTDLCTLSARISQWASIYLVWDEQNWCAVGQISPTPFGRLFSTAVIGGQDNEVDHRGIDFGSSRLVRIKLGGNYVRFEFSNDNGKNWTELRTIERPKEFTGPPKLMAIGKYYENADKPFDLASYDIKSSSTERISGRVSNVIIEQTPEAESNLSEIQLQELRKPKIDPVTSILNESDEDPTYEKVVKFYPPMKAPREVVGVPAHPLDIGVDRLGRLDVSPWAAPVAWFETGDPITPLGRDGIPFKRRLMNGYLPIDTLKTSRDGIDYELTIFGWSENFSVEKPLIAYARMIAISSNGTPLPQKIALVSPTNTCHTWNLPQSKGRQTEFCVAFEYPNPGSAKAITTREFDSKLKEVSRFWEKRLALIHRFDVPDTRVMEAYRAWVAYSLLNADTVNGYIEPHDGAGFYEEMFGNSVSMHSMAMDMYGLHSYTASILNTQIHFQQSNGLYTQVCGLTDPGGFLVGLAKHYQMTGDKEWLLTVSPGIIKQCEWLMQQRERTSKDGLVRGLIKFRPYNDYSGEVYNYLGNMWCAKGLEEAAKVLEEIKIPGAGRYAAEAANYRQDILDSMQSAAFDHQGQTLLPFEPETRRLLKLERYKGGGYYGLTVSPALGIGLLAPDDKPTTWIVDALEKRGGLIAGVCEFEGGIDHAYTYGYLLNELKRGEVRKTLLGFWSMLAFGMTRDTYSPVEVTMIETGENHYTLPHLYSCTEQLHLLRQMLLREDGDVLCIGDGIPRAWLEPGNRVVVNAAPTEFGEVSYKIEPKKDGSMQIHILPPTRHMPKKIELRLRAPSQKIISSVKSNRKANLTYQGERITIENPTSPVDLHVQFKP
ncbi:hypothetical protein [Pedosphaera parvula]|uniref:hypothetical protein n=1 Tax=Pedosphaera parvula TaxID=1032527 RepID=UPI0012371FD6|nr:hypothetical protein [Pedosphaera parvula]